MSYRGDVLVLRALGIGDLLVAVPALRGLRRAFPRSRIALAAPFWLAELVVLTGAVDRLVPTPGLGALRWADVAPEVAVNLHGSGPESVADLVATEPQRLLTHRHGDFPDLDGPAWREETHERVRWCRLLEWYGIAADPMDLTLDRPDRPDVAPGATVVHPGASVPARRWPADRFAAVARALTADGHQVVVTGSADEADLAGTVARAAGLPDTAVLAGSTGLGELAALVAGAGLVVSGDTGVGHLATAYDTPSVLLFGSTSPARWGPPADRAHSVLWAGTAPDSLLRLAVPDVLTAAGEILSRPV